MTPPLPLGSLSAQLRALNRSARLFLLATIFSGVVWSAWFLFFNFYILERGFGRDFLGLLNALPSVAALLFGIPIGALSDRLGRKRSLLLGVSVAIICMGLEVTLLDPTWLLVAAFVGGMGNMLFYISQAPFMMKVAQGETRTLLFSLNFGLSTLSGAVGNVFAGQLPALFGDMLHVPARSATAYQAVLLMSVALSLMTLIPLALLREPAVTSPAAAPPAKSARWQVARHPLTVRLALPNMLIGLGAAILIPYMNVFFHDRFDLPDATLGILFSLLALSTGLGSLLAPRLVRWLGGKIPAVVFTQSLSLVFLLLLGFSPYLWLASLGFLLRGTLMNMAAPLYHAFALEQIRESEQGIVNSVLELAWNIGWAIGPYVSGVVQQSAGFTPLFIATAVLYALANLFAWLFFHKRETASIQEAESLSVFSDVLGD
jgi:MFS family permease